MAKTFRTVGLDFIDSALQRTVVRVHLGHPPAAVFAALADAPGSPQVSKVSFLVSTQMDSRKTHFSRLRACHGYAGQNFW